LFYFQRLPCIELISLILWLICTFSGQSSSGAWWETATSSHLDWPTVCSFCPF
jgi:hypothetical protein